MAALQSRLEVEKSQQVIAIIKHYLNGASTTQGEVPDGKYLAYDGAMVDIPDFEPLIDTGEAPFDETDLAALKAIDQKQFEKDQQRYPIQLEFYQNVKTYPRSRKPEKPCLKTNAAKVFAEINRPIRDEFFNGVNNWHERFKHPFAGNKVDLENWYAGAVSKLPDKRLVDIALLMSRSVETVLRSGWYRPVLAELSQRLSDDVIDVRQVLAVARARKVGLKGRNSTPMLQLKAHISRF